MVTLLSHFVLPTPHPQFRTWLSSSLWLGLVGVAARVKAAEFFGFLGVGHGVEALGGAIHPNEDFLIVGLGADAAKEIAAGLESFGGDVAVVAHSSEVIADGAESAVTVCFLLFGIGTLDSGEELEAFGDSRVDDDIGVRADADIAGGSLAD